MPGQTFQLRGQVVDHITREGIPNLHVEAWDRDPQKSDFLGRALTDARGNFIISFTDTQFGDDGMDPLPDVYFKIFVGKKVVYNSEAQPIRNWTPQQTPLVIEVPKPPASQAKSYTVIGRVLQVNGPPVTGVEVQALHKNLRSEISLGKERTDAKGFYTIRYEPPQGVNAVDLVVRVVGADRELARSELICHAGRLQVVDVIVGGETYRGFSEFERLNHALIPNLDGASLVALNVEDIELLACKTQQDALRIAYLVVANRYEHRTDANAAAFYGFFRQGLPTSLPALLSQQARVQGAALKRAVRANIIPAALEPRIKDILRQLKAAAVTLALEVPEGQQHTSLSGLLSTTGLAADQQHALLTRYALHEGTIEEFWSALKQDPAFGPARVGKLQFTLQLGALAGGYVPLVQKLQERGEAGQVRSVQNLAALQYQDWLALVKQTGTPPGTPGETQLERAELYAKRLGYTIELAFPTPSIVAGLKRNGFPGQADLLRFFNNSPDFTFETNIDRYLKDKGNAPVTGIADVAKTTQQLKQLQRLYNVSPPTGRFDAMSALLNAGLDSAHAIVHAGQDVFIKSLNGTLGGEAVAKDVYATAAQTNALATSVFGQYSTALGIGTPAVIRNHTALGADVPNWETLFGSLSFCECEHCRSVYGPAAYFVDLLQFVKQQLAIEIVSGTVTYPTVLLPDGTTRPKTALDVLFERRSDLGEIQLSCQNTNTLLPYIDLVNEVLENAVVRQSTVYQTTWAAEELAANAEHQNDTAYHRLARRVYPRLLPFNLWLQEARTYLGHLGLSLVELMEVLHRPGRTGGALAELEQQIAIESLGLSPVSARIITGTLQPARSPWEFWGWKAEPTGWPGLLADLPSFLKQAEIEYTTLDTLRKTRFINSAGRLTVKFTTPCNTEGATITNLTEPVLDRMHRFLRLQQAIGWEIAELDSAITAMNATDLTTGFLAQVSQIQRLKSELSKSLLETLSWWSTISTVVDETDPEDRSLYDELFLNNAVLSPVDEAFQLNSARNDLQNAGTAPLGEHKPTILAALAVTEADLLLLLSDIGKTEADGLTLDLLSELHRRASLARALELSVSDFLSVRKLTGMDPFANPKAAVDFSAETETIDQSQFSVATLDYLLRHVYLETSGLAPTESGITLVLDGIKAGLQTIATENVFSADPTGEVTRGRLALLLTGDDLQQAINIIEGTSTLPQAEQEAFIDQHFTTFLHDTTDAKAILTRPIDPDDPANTAKQKQLRYEHMLAPLVAYLKVTLSTQVVVQAIADALGLETAVSEALLTEYVTAPNDASKKVIDIFLHIDLEAETYSEAELNTYRLLHKIATVLTTLKATADELIWVFEKGPTLGWLDLKRLPLAVPSDTAAAQLYTGWKRLVALYDFRDRYPAAGDVTVFSILDLVHSGSDRNSVLATLTSLTGWNADDVEFLTGAGGFNLTYPAGYRDERYFVYLRTAVDLLTRLGVSAEAADGWKVFDNLERMKAVSTAIKSTVKAKYDNATWLGVAEPLKNQLREQQRSALVAHLIARRPAIEEANDLFERYLIDVEMNACMKTSRIKQAISSVQLFVQRSLMNLEPNVEISELSAAQWDWMKNYRVWEANRKIFLYPENWIVPELRDNKSPFFKELENDLLQNEITRETAETALVSYLEKLDDVANLDVRALYHQKEDGEAPIDILHVFARTHATPHVYYYRTYVDAAYWTPWEKLGIDIDGDHLLAVVWNRRLYLIWPLFKEIAAGTAVCKPLATMIEEAFPDIVDSEIWQEGGADVVTEDFEAKWETELEADEFDTQSAVDELGEGFLDNSNIPLDGLYQLVADWADCRSKNQLEIQLAWAEYKDGTWTAEKVTEETLTVLHSRKQAIFLKSTITHPQTFVGGLSRTTTSQLFDSSDLLISCFTSRAQTDAENGYFRFTGCHGRVVVTAYEDEPVSLTHLFDASISPVNMQFVEDEGVDLPLMLPSSQVDSTSWTEGLAVQYPTVLNKTPGQFTLAVPHQYNEYFSQDALFYQDDTCCFHVTPGNQFPRYSGLQDTDAVYFETATRSASATLGATARDGTGSRGDALGASHPSDSRKVRRIDHEGRQPLALKASEGFMIQDLLDQSNPGTNGGVVGGQTVVVGTETVGFKRVYAFASFYHPHVCTFFEELNAKGIDGLMQRDVQARSSEFFTSTYDPDDVVTGPYPLKNVDFSSAGAYSPYNWELFFHAPLMIATRLSQNQRFEEAQRWFNYIFNPAARVDSSAITGPERYWNFLPFYEENMAQTIDELMLELNGGDAELEAQVEAWRETPFNPHLIARMRPVAYQKTVVMKYLDNLIAWGDSLFRQDTIESINEATQLYVLAANILGPRPQSLPADQVEDSETYNSLADKLDAFSNALVQIENQIPAIKLPSFDILSFDPLGGIVKTPVFPRPESVPLPSVDTLYFCVPKNEELCAYWDTVADRLFKIRNCMNIEGVVRELALFEPPINPMLLVQAAAAGIDISSALSDLYAPLTPYRFQFMLQKAMEFCADVRSLGAGLLAALEKKDAEELALLRASHEKQLLETIKQTREKQVDEVNETLESLTRTREVSNIRLTYYQQLLSSGLSPQEFLNLVHLILGQAFESMAGDYELRAAKNYRIPDLSVSVSIPPVSGSASSSYGGSFLGNNARAQAAKYRNVASNESFQANLTSITGGHERRKQEWQHQVDLATKELEQIDKQIAAAQIRVAIAEQELDSHNQQIEHAQAVHDVMTNKYTNQDLYNWMISQISGIYFQSYQMAYDLAKRAEKAYQHELGVRESGFISFGYWDSLKKGLLSGEKLHYDLRRMEKFYLEQNKREYEITKHVSLTMLDPIALIQLKQTGDCFISLPEVLFDLDCPGHYQRRMRSVSVTIPCVTGPYTSVNCTLTLQKSSIRHDSTLLNGTTYLRDVTEDVRFTDSLGAIQSIVTSSGQNDPGLFEANLRDERYLPFEGAGVISDWRLQLPNDLRSFDYATISDVILHIRYTAREGGDLLRNAAVTSLQDYFSQAGTIPSERLIDLRQEFPSQWQRFLYPVNPATGNVLELEMSPELFPFKDEGESLKVDSIWLLARCTDAGNYSVKLSPPLPAPPPADSDTFRLAPSDDYGGLHVAQKDTSALNVKIDPSVSPIKWKFTMVRPGGGTLLVDPPEVEDLLLVLGYRWE